MEEAIMAEDLGIQRQQLVESLRNAGLHDEDVLHVIASIPREIFLDEAQRGLAYEDRALPIDLGQLSLSPYVDHDTGVTITGRSEYWKSVQARVIRLPLSRLAARSIA